ncbi:unnamed protein product, partial [Sphacelaria rigidula]
EWTSDGITRCDDTGLHEAAGAEDSSSLEAYYPSDLDSSQLEKGEVGTESYTEGDFETDGGESAPSSITGVSAVEEAVDHTVMVGADGVSLREQKEGTDKGDDDEGLEYSPRSSVAETSRGDSDLDTQKQFEDDDFEEDVEEVTTSVEELGKGSHDLKADSRGTSGEETRPKLAVPSATIVDGDIEVLKGNQAEDRNSEEARTS